MVTTHSYLDIVFIRLKRNANLAHEKKTRHGVFYDPSLITITCDIPLSSIIARRLARVVARRGPSVFGATTPPPPSFSNSHTTGDVSASRQQCMQGAHIARITRARSTRSRPVADSPHFYPLTSSPPLSPPFSLSLSIPLKCARKARYCATGTRR